jgi:phosphoserine phosphatase RsbU/P
MHAPLINYSDQDGKHAIELTGDSTSIGRSPDRDLVLSDYRVSRNHAIILRSGVIHTLVDQNSKHGTFVNGRRVQETVLQSGDLLQFGSPDGLQLNFVSEDTEEIPHPSGQGLLHLISSTTQLDMRSEDSAHGGEIRRLNWILDAARQINAGEAMEDILRVLLQHTLRLTRLERGFVFLNGDAGLHFATGLHGDGSPLQEDSCISQHAVHQSIQSGARFYIGDTCADDDARLWHSVIANQIRSIICIPLRKRAGVKGSAELLGLLYLDSQLKQGFLTEIDHNVLELIATETATLLENALLAESENRARQAREELAFAGKIHNELMSFQLPFVSYATVEARSVPCLAIGGDFYDVVVSEDSIYLTLVDISGKGVSAAIVAATLQGIIHVQLLAQQPLEVIAGVVNKFLCTRSVGKYATMVILRLFSTGMIEYINCGHIQPLVVLGARVRRLEAGSTVVGLISTAEYRSAHDSVRPGERLILTTDGIMEAENNMGEQFGETGLDAIAHFNDVDAILDHVARYQAPATAQDDCTLIRVVYTGASAPN